MDSEDEDEMIEKRRKIRTELLEKLTNEKPAAEIETRLLLFQNTAS